MNAERALLGAMLTSRNAVAAASELVEAVDLYDMRMGEVFAAIMALDADHAPIDAMTVVDKLMERGSLERVGGSDVVAGLLVEAPASASAGFYAKKVAESAQRRRLLTAIDQIRGVVSDPEVTTDAATLMEHAYSMLDEARPIRSAGTATIGGALDDVIENLSKPSSSLPSPWRALNDKIDGFRPGGLYVVGARPGAGKSIVGLQVAAHLARWGAVAVSSLEMSQNELMERLLAQRGGIHMTALSRHALSNADWNRVSRVHSELASAQIFVDDRSGITLPQIRAHVRSVARQGKLTAVVVDYLQLIRASDSKRPRWESVTEFSRSLKVMARDFNVPVIALAQLNRESETNRRAPTLSDLRESGSIEQDADVVLLLQRVWDEAAGIALDEVDVIVAKNRHGMAGKITLAWEGQFARLADLPWAE